MINLLENRDIDEFINKSIHNPNIELEYIFGYNEKQTYEILNKDLFLRLLSFCNSKYIKVDTSTNLDIRIEEIIKGISNLNRIRITLNDLYSIKKYCKGDILEKDMNIDYLEKKRYKDKKWYNIRDEDYNYRINLNIENILNETSPEVLNIIE